MEDGASAKMNEHWRSRKSTWSSIQNMSPLDPSQIRLPRQSPTVGQRERAQAKRFVALCDEFCLDGAYFYYRMMSSYSHASVEVADHYVDVDGDGNLEFLARPKPATNDERA